MENIVRLSEREVTNGHMDMTMRAGLGPKVFKERRKSAASLASLPAPPLRSIHSFVFLFFFFPPHSP